MITTATQDELNEALRIINKATYAGNIKIRDWKHLSSKRIQFTITVVSSRGPGARRSWTGRRIAAACWHAHGDLFDALFKIRKDIVIWTDYGWEGKMKITSEGGNWQDMNVGSLMDPAMMSESCECTGR